MDDFFTFEYLVNHVHGAINHFPIALLFVSAGLDFFAGKRPHLRFSAWLLLVLGTIGATFSAGTSSRSGVSESRALPVKMPKAE